ncbi:MAG: hypothetical protein ACJ8GW_14145 [Massilia sp.]
MDSSTEQYKGFAISVRAVKDCEDLWDFTYQISGPGRETSTRSQSAGGHATPAVACAAGLTVARIEVDNLLAMSAGGAPAQGASS